MARNEMLDGDVATVFEQGKWRCVARGGQRLATLLTFDNGPDYVRDGLMRYVDGTKIGFVDEACRIRIRAVWDFAFSFSEGLAVVCQGCRSEPVGEHSVSVGGQWGYIDKRGTAVIPPSYDTASPFVDGYAQVELEGRRFKLNRSGKRVAEMAPER
jgi:hypothetical protein